ncbi:hypothetical protein ECANGB1_678 [Enterospora canceri]|uniref:Uncharacterized protein n=1 Tax=Enterospora canceri TaxID=1081671 RepID=A0A1Y1S7S7_9MICR|nr:hypothetical protein ECANGB1_678 [Enterospora canceri]
MFLDITKLLIVLISCSRCAMLLTEQQSMEQDLNTTIVYKYMKVKQLAAPVIENLGQYERVLNLHDNSEKINNENLMLFSSRSILYGTSIYAYYSKMNMCHMDTRTKSMELINLIKQEYSGLVESNLGVLLDLDYYAMLDNLIQVLIKYDKLQSYFRRSFSENKTVEQLFEDVNAVIALKQELKSVIELL